jgi:hypothetical protein
VLFEAHLGRHLSVAPSHDSATASRVSRALDDRMRNVFEEKLPGLDTVFSALERIRHGSKFLMSHDRSHFEHTTFCYLRLYHAFWPPAFCHFGVALLRPGTDFLECFVLARKPALFTFLTSILPLPFIFDSDYHHCGRRSTGCLLSFPNHCTACPVAYKK